VLGCFAADSRPHDVYNLSVEDAHEFYANGVLVHNCDASRYVLINIGGEPRFHFPAADPAAGLPRLIVPSAAGTRDYEGPPLPAMIGGFPVLRGDDPWHSLLG